MVGVFYASHHFAFNQFVFTLTCMQAGKCLSTEGLNMNNPVLQHGEKGNMQNNTTLKELNNFVIIVNIIRYLGRYEDFSGGGVT